MSNINIILERKEGDIERLKNLRNEHIKNYDMMRTNIDLHRVIMESNADAFENFLFDIKSAKKINWRKIDSTPIEILFEVKNEIESKVFQTRDEAKIREAQSDYMNHMIMYHQKTAQIMKMMEKLEKAIETISFKLAIFEKSITS